MKLELILSKKNEKGDFPVFLYKFNNEAQVKLNDWLNTIDLNESVLVCYEKFNDKLEYRNKISTLLISHDMEEIKYYCDFKLDYYAPNDAMYFCVIEFESYKEAITYCKNLREGL